MTTSATAETLLSFWFGAAADDVAVARSQAALWWSKHPDADQGIRERFEGLLQRSMAGPPPGWPDTPRGRLARVILLDQFPRSMYRGRPEAFIWDETAREAASAALASGDECHLRPIERVFLYLPFEHSESLEDQDLAVERFRELCAQAPETGHQVFEGFLDFALRHRDIIRRFGRFPHRNAILGRSSTAGEAAFLQEPGSSF